MSFGIVFAVTLGVTALTVPITMRIARRVGAIAVPGDRRVHATPTPTLGGAAMYVGMLAGVGAASMLGQFRAAFEASGNVAAVVVAATIIFGTGIIDDVREVSAPAKLAGMVLAGSVLSLGGVTIFNLPLPFIGFTVLSPDLAALVTVVWVVTMANAVNIIDGLDGLAALSSPATPGRCSRW